MIYILIIMLFLQFMFFCEWYGEKPSSPKWIKQIREFIKDGQGIDNQHP